MINTMSLIKKLLVLVLVTLPILAHCDKWDELYYNASNCYSWYLPNGNGYGYVKFPTSQSCISLGVDKSYITPGSFLTLTRDKYYVSANRPGGGSNKVGGYELEEILYFFVNTLPDGKEEGPFVYTGYLGNETDKFSYYSDDHQWDEAFWTINKKNNTITYAGLNNSFYNKKKKNLSDIKSTAINIRFQVVSKIHINRGYGNKNRNDADLSIKGGDVNVQFYNCDPGQIGSNTKITPKIVERVEESGYKSTRYCVYPIPTGDLSSTALQITNVESPGDYGRDLYFSWDLNRYQNFGFDFLSGIKHKRFVKNPDNNRTLDKFETFSYSDLKDFKVGDKFEISRSISLTNKYNNELNCSTPALTFEVVPEAFLSEKGETSQGVCPIEGNINYDGGINATKTGKWVYLNGEAIKFRDSDFREVQLDDALYNAYGIKYGWEYSTDGLNWISLNDREIEKGTKILPFENYNYISGHLSFFNPQDLLVPKNMFEGGKTYYFRQVVTLENFLNRKIVSDKLHEINTYNLIEKKNFKFSPLETLCADGQNQEVALNVTFTPSDNVTLDRYGWVTEKALLKYSYSFFENKEEEYEGENLKADYNVYSDEATDYDAVVTVTDGCGTKIDLKETLIFEEQPKLDPDNVVCSNSTYEYNEIQDRLEVVIPEGVIGYLNIDKSDENYTTSQYKYSTDGYNYDKISSHGVEVLLTTKKEKTYYIKKISNRGRYCESEILTVLVKKVSAIAGNNIDKDTVYVCKGSGNPRISGEGVNGGFGEGATLSYSWIYSYDDKTYTAMLDANSNALTDVKMKEGVWNQTVDKKVYIRRIVTSRKGTGMMSDTSAAVVVMPYSDPVVALRAKSFVCYGDTVKLNGSVDAKFMSQIEKTNTEVNYAYVGGKGTSIYSNTTLSPYPITITKDTVVYAEVEFCGKKVSGKGVTITSGNNLEPKKKEGDCKVRGKKMEVSVVGPNADYTYKINGEEGYTAEINVPKNGGLEYNITVNDSKCEKTFVYEVEDGNLQDSLRHFELAVDGSKLADGQKVCAGVTHSFANIDQESIDQIANNYTWYVDGKSQSYSSDASFTFLLPTPGKTYTVIRKSEAIENGYTCQSIIDSIKVVTFDKISGATLAASKETVCYGDSVNLTIGGAKGASEAEYKYTIYDGTKAIVTNTVDFGESAVENVDRLETAGMHNLYAVVRDTSNCNNNDTYLQKTEKIQLYQAETAEFRLTASPSVINEDAGLTKVIINAAANNGDKVIADKFAYSYKTDKGPINEEATGNFYISVSGSDFIANGILTINVERTVYSTGCKASGSVTITQTSGFEDQPSIICDAAKDGNQVEICGGSTAKLSIAVLPAYGKTTLTSKDVSYVWYRNEQMVGKDSVYMATAKAGDTSHYQCKISYVYDAASNPAFITSKEFTVIGKKGVVLGKVYQQDDKSRNLALCVGSDDEIALGVDAEYNPSKDELSWWESTDGKTWNPISETNIKDQMETSLVLKTSYYTGAKGKHYIRVKGTSDCGTETYSKSFTLEVEDLPTAPEVALRSTNVINVTASVLNFSPKSNYAGYRYEWGVSEDDMPFFSTGGAYAAVEGEYITGENTVYVRKVSTTGGHCTSAAVPYTFNLYEELSIGDLMATTQAKVRCPNETKHTLQISGVTGGSGEYAITWQYKSEGGDWISFGKESVLPFEFSIEDPVKLAGGSIFQLLVEGLSVTTTFRAIVLSTGDYKGAVKYSTEYKIEYYEPLKDEGIDISETLVCYGMTNDGIAGKTTTGGNVSTPYQYQWYRTTNRDSDVWEAIPSATLQNYTKRDTLTETTFYKRVVTDGCGSSLESVAKRVGVNDIVEIKAEDIRYEAVVSDGNVATMWGMPNGEADASQYVWYNENWQTLDTTDVRELYVTKNSLTVTGINQHSKLYVYYAKKYIDGCLSHNSDTLYITASKNTSGCIFINAENEDNFWVCTGTKDIEILSENNPLNAKRYSWFYRITEYNADDEAVQEFWSPVGGTNELYATGENINLDTCGLGKDALKNAKGRKKYVELKRVAEFEVAGNEVAMESNIVRINVVPTMASIPLTLTSITGTISSEKEFYCKGDMAEPVYGDETDPSSVVLDIWRTPNKYFGPGLYDPEYGGGIYTWFEYSVDGSSYDTVRMINSVKDNDFAKSFYPGEGMEGLMNQTYYVRRGVSDGCTSVYSNKLVLSVSDEVGSLSSISMYALEPGKTDVQDRISKGFEFGDSLVVGESSREAFYCKWSLDSLMKDTFETNKQFVGFALDEDVSVRLMDDPNIYMKRKSKKSLYGDCWSSSLQIPIAVGTSSKGGLISENQKVCFGSDFSGIDNIEEASGEWISPRYTEMKWTYSWQWSQDSAKWVSIENSDSISLDAELVNKFVDPLKLKAGKTTYFRRVATNDSSRVRYSNVAVLSYYKEMKPGELSDDNNGKAGYCSDETLPVISTTKPTGGTFEENGISYTWKVALDDGEYVELATTRTTLDLGIVDTIYKQTLDKNVKVSVICEYTDGVLGCGTVESEPLDYILYRRNVAPGIYQDNDSCDAQTVAVKVVPEKIEKTYIFGTFVNTENGDSLTWESEATEKTIRRVTTMIVDEYGVYSIDNETGCHSEYTKFNVDSLPDLSQGSLVAPSAVCYGESYTVKGGNVVGGNGSKTFTWQYSYDDVEWETLSNQSEEDLEVVKPKSGISYRRIVSDMCGVDTSNAVHIEVREKIDVTKDVLVFNDFKCANRMFNINTAENVDFTDMDYYLVWNSATGETFDTKGMARHTVDGFEGDSLEMSLTHAIVDTTGMICKSVALTVYAHNAIALDPEANRISCDNITPCNGRYVEIEGESQGGVYADKIGYKWYVSGDEESWTEQLLKTDKDLSLQVADTMYVRRVAYNGCDHDTSNVVTIIGTKVEPYDYIGNMALEITSDMQDSSVAMSIERGKEFDSVYFFEGDGELPKVTGNTTALPYKAETYRDSILMLVANSDKCVSAYRFNPLRGGVISFDGDSVLCGGGEIPAIVATLTEGGNGNYSYQWQYKNIYTADYVDIDGANGKEFTPSAVNVETYYRRKTTAGEYTSLSNEIRINIRPLPKTADIEPSVNDSILKSYNLNFTQYSVEKLPSMDLTLIDSISDADMVTWQKSYDDGEWENVELQEVNEKGVYELAVVDTTDVVYYRAVATSTCGERTSKSYKVTTLYASVIMDEELVLTDSVCVGSQYVRIRYKKDYSDVYEYSYKTIDYEGSGVFELSSAKGEGEYPETYYSGRKNGLEDTTKVASGAIFTYPKHSFDVEVTRWVKSTGASSSKLIHFYVNELSAKFSYVVDGVENYESGEKRESVRLNQGSRVVFTPEIVGGLEEKRYKWNLIAPLNVGYYKTNGGDKGREGLVSERVSPVCYFYNQGSYPITMQVSDGMCKATVSDSALYISEATRGYLRSASFEEEVIEYVELESKELGYVEVYPTHISDQISIFSDYKKTLHYEVYNTLGVKVKEGDFTGNVMVDTDDLVPGSYAVKIAEKVIMVVKSK